MRKVQFINTIDNINVSLIQKQIKETSSKIPTMSKLKGNNRNNTVIKPCYKALFIVTDWDSTISELILIINTLIIKCIIDDRYL